MVFIENLLPITSNSSFIIFFFVFIFVKSIVIRSIDTLPTKLIDQLKCNPFLQCDHEHFQKLYKSTDPIEVFGQMRKAKDNF